MTDTVRVPRATLERLLVFVPSRSGLALHLRAMLAASPQGEGSPADAAPIKPSADTGELRDDVLERLRTLDFAGHYDEARFQYIADTILDLIQSERAG